MCRKEEKGKENRKQAKKKGIVISEEKSSSPSIFITKRSTKFFLRSMLDTSVLSSSRLIRLLFVVCQKRKSENDCYMSIVSRLDESLFSFVAHYICIL